jgi:hypothetical protein
MGWPLRFWSAEGISVKWRFSVSPRFQAWEQVFWQLRLGAVSLPFFPRILSVSPWKGWLIVDEIDLQVLTVVVAGNSQRPSNAMSPQRARPFFLPLIVLLLARGANRLSCLSGDFLAAVSTQMVWRPTGPVDRKAGDE